jgi:hypothetical protein
VLGQLPSLLLLDAAAQTTPEPLVFAERDHESQPAGRTRIAQEQLAALPGTRKLADACQGRLFPCHAGRRRVRARRCAPGFLMSPRDPDTAADIAGPSGRCMTTNVTSARACRRCGACQCIHSCYRWHAVRWRKRMACTLLCDFFHVFGRWHIH